VVDRPDQASMMKVSGFAYEMAERVHEIVLPSVNPSIDTRDGRTRRECRPVWVFGQNCC
jgi:hypothetical protein